MFNQTSLNSPIGYSKNPYNPTFTPQSAPETVSAQIPRDSSPSLDVSRLVLSGETAGQSVSNYSYRSTLQGSAVSGTSFENLPFEIRSRIAAELSQYDCLNLLLVSKTVFASTVGRLYEHIVIDQQFSRFSNENEYGYKKLIKHDDHLVSSSCTYINSSYAFKRFLKSVNSHTTSLIRCFDCIDLPDSLNLYDHELHDRLLQLFGKMSSLTQLIWLNDNFRLDYLHRLPEKVLITVLVLNIRFSNYIGELEPQPCEEDCRGLSFPNLVDFEIQPFQNSRKLIKIINNLLINKNPQVCENLDTLAFSRYQRLDATSSMLFPNCHELIAANTSCVPEEERVSAFLLGSRLRNLSNLTSLSLDNMIVTVKDAETLARHVNLQNLHTLNLRGISEYTIENQPTGFFLLEIGQHLNGLRNLALDHRQALIDSIPEFLLKLPNRQLETLELTIRNNPTKTFLDNGVQERAFYDEYARAISSFGNTLKKLSIEVREEVHGYSDSNNINVLRSIPTHTNFYARLQSAPRLTCLRLNPGEQVNEVAALVGQLPNLRMLDIFGSKAGGAPNLGLGMVHPSIYDEWFKVQHVALFYAQHNDSLRYIRINDCVFESSSSTVEPRCGLSRWFDGKVKLCKSDSF